MFFEKVASIERLTVVVGSSDKEQYQPVGNMSGVRINIQPASAELTAVSNGVYGQTYRGFVSVSGIKISDRITISGTSKQFIVKGIQDWFYSPIPHLELVLFEGDN